MPLHQEAALAGQQDDKICRPSLAVVHGGGPLGVLEYSTTPGIVVILFNIDAVNIVDERIIYSETAFSEIVVWALPRRLEGSTHDYKYRLAYVVDGVCVLRFDNEAGKGDHFHHGSSEASYEFVSIDALLTDFLKHIQRWNH